MNTPKYVGPKKGYSSIWLSFRKKYQIVSSPRIRCINSKGRAAWDFLYPSVSRRFNFNARLCWFDPHLSEKQNIIRLKRYDQIQGRETIFFGYVKDTE